jgi:plasmid stabilization system protein ParE
VPPVKPLTLVISQRARERVREATEWLFSLSEEAAERFDAAVQAEMPALCHSVAEQIAGGIRLIPDEDASLAFSRPVYLHLFTTAKKRRRRSPSGTWRVYFDLRDADGDGTPDTLRVLTVRHAAARPLWDVDDGVQDDQDDEG